jgi:hypothetical protein
MLTGSYRKDAEMSEHTAVDLETPPVPTVEVVTEHQLAEVAGGKGFFAKVGSYVGRPEARWIDPYVDEIKTAAADLAHDFGDYLDNWRR